MTSGRRRGGRGRRKSPARIALVAALGCLVASTAAVASAHGAIKRMATSTAVSVPAVTGDARADLLLARMSLTDKLRLLEWAPDRSVGPFKAARLRGIPRLGIPVLRLVDGLPGETARGVVPAMTAPLGVAATFSRADAYANGTAIGRDARALGDQVVALPFADLVRDPAWSQAGSTFGEDPLLAGQTAAAEIEGIQSQHTMALAKGYIGADGSSNVVLDSQTLHEIYLQPFADAVRARVAAIMCARGTVSVLGATPSGAMGPGAPDCDNAGTLTRVLRRELGFAGFVTSDWGANPATQSLNSGLDTEMPGLWAATRWAASPGGPGATAHNSGQGGSGKGGSGKGGSGQGGSSPAQGGSGEGGSSPAQGGSGEGGSSPAQGGSAIGHSDSPSEQGASAPSPGAGFFSTRALRGAIADGTLSLATVNRAAGAVLAEMDRFGLLGTARGASDVPVAADEGVAARTAQDAATLLKNSRNALPLTARDLASLALIGPGAGQIIADGQTAAPSLHPAGSASGAQPGRAVPGAPAPAGTTPSTDTPTPSGAMPSGAMPSGAMPSGAMPSGAMPSVATSSETAPLGRSQQPDASGNEGRAGRAGGSGYSASLVDAGTYQVLSEYLRNDQRAHLSYAAADDLTGTPIPASALSHEGELGLVRTSAGSGTTQVVPVLDNTLAGGDALPPGSAHAWVGELTVPVTGTYWIDLGLLGAKGSVSLDGATIAQTRSGPALRPRRGITQPTTDSIFPAIDGLDNLRAQVRLTAGTHIIGVSVAPDSSGRPVQVRLDWVTPNQQQAELSAAAAAAAHARTAVVFAWSDRGSRSPLPDGQDQLIEDVAAVNPRTIVVLNTPGPVPMPWLGSVKAVLQMWHPGAAGGEATANVLLGRVNPAGRLPVTWPAAVTQGPANQPRTHPERTSAGVDVSGRLCRTPAPATTGASGCTSTYSEGIFVGYRWFGQRRLAPLFPFGYGISYTRFAYSGLSWWTAVGGSLAVRFRVTNTGRVAGEEVPQVYLGPPVSPPPGVAFAPKALAAYTRVGLRPRQSTVVTLYVPLRQFQYWDDARGWVTATGPRPLYVGPNERTAYVTANVTAAG